MAFLPYYSLAKGFLTGKYRPFAAQGDSARAGEARAYLDLPNANAVLEALDQLFGRKHLIGNDGDLVKIEHPPFYAVVAVPGTSHFNGGLKIDSDMRVLDVWGEPIPGVYAAGEVTGGFHGSGYMSATHVGSALIFGHGAGIHAATKGS